MSQSELEMPIIYGDICEIVKVVLKSYIFKKSVFPEFNGKGAQLAAFSSTGPAGHFLSY